MKAKLLKALRDPRRASRKAARKAGKLGRLIRESIRLRLGQGRFDTGRPEDVLDLGGAAFADWFRGKTCPLWPAGALAAIRSACPAPERAAIVAAADRIRDHVFDYLGSGPVRLGTGRLGPDGYESIPWHLDYCHGSAWPGDRHHRFVPVVKGDGSDIKYLWELSRFHQLLTLGQAATLTGDAAYAREYRLQALDWLAANPTDAGPNWQCCMEVGIRAANFALSLFLVKDSPGIDPGFAGRAMVSLWRHCDHIVHNLEYSEELTSNHYLSNIAGLHMVCTLFPELKGADRWLEFARAEIAKEMFKQVHPDGTDFEASTCYHRLVLELFFYPALLGKAAGKPFPPAYLDRLEAMFGVIHALTKHDGHINQVGDNDSGRYLNFGPGRDGLDMTYLLGLGALFFGKPGLLLRELGDASEARWAFAGRDLAALLPQAPSLREVHAAAFPDSGWYVYRDARVHLQISCGPNGQGPAGGHAHNDKLSFCLQVDGHDVFTDPGTYVYTSDVAARNLFRATSRHTTASLEGREQNPFTPGVPFHLEDRTRARATRWSADGGGCAFTGFHMGYDPIRHVRDIAYAGAAGTLTVRDRFEGAPEGAGCEIYFQLASGAQAAISGREARIHSGGADTVLSISDPAASLELAASGYSPGYGILAESARIIVKASCAGGAVHETSIRLATP